MESDRYMVQEYMDKNKFRTAYPICHRCAHLILAPRRRVNFAGLEYSTFSYSCDRQHGEPEQAKLRPEGYSGRQLYLIMAYQRLGNGTYLVQGLVSDHSFSL